MKYIIVVLICLVSYLAISDGLCHILYGSGVSRKDQEIIVNEHNARRIRIANGNVTGQPKGSNLKRMSWDVNLAKEAQKIANKCVYEYVKANDTRFDVGQNIFKLFDGQGPIETFWERAVKEWFMEVSRYEYGTTIYNNYTKIVWADTYLIGCGFTKYKNYGSSLPEQLYVCNYGPGGNIQGQTPYEIGAGCENLC